ncbi:hypothetical protein CAPTEDRAFT_203084 [Capitella teleta]|uniref:Uncharacterized protein n=1 Tax=Capitella teleta TaxID=283909 RepID=R7V5C6_CAPTE|nr:hypothetical protein CAPTEDRAFT_203084 [Capitella teleta]|eukprot:ELU10990.1 hypothetical protein CAPTEDRAFT_203084 [Capitella teleta]
MTNQQRQYRPSLDWTPDTKLPQRFARWKEEMQDEILLFEGDEKSPKYICNFLKVCSDPIPGRSSSPDVKLCNHRRFRHLSQGVDHVVCCTRVTFDYVMRCTLKAACKLKGGCVRECTLLELIRRTQRPRVHVGTRVTRCQLCQVEPQGIESPAGRKL